jgi:hypothetical protein
LIFKKQTHKLFPACEAHFIKILIDPQNIGQQLKERCNCSLVRERNVFREEVEVMPDLTKCLKCILGKRDNVNTSKKKAGHER